jgi:hypothetical protein
MLHLLFVLAVIAIAIVFIGGIVRSLFWGWVYTRGTTPDRPARLRPIPKADLVPIAIVALPAALVLVPAAFVLLFMIVGRIVSAVWR